MAHNNGYGSFDPDGAKCGADPANYAYRWTFVSKPANSALTDASIADATTLSDARFTPDVSGEYVLQLSFTDHQGNCLGSPNTGTATVKIKAGYFVQKYDVIYEGFPKPAPFPGAKWVPESITPYGELGIVFIYEAVEGKRLRNCVLAGFLLQKLRRQIERQKSVPVAFSHG